MIRLRRSHRAAMVGLLLIGFALGALKLNADSLWLDELYSLSNMGVFDRPYNLPEVIDSLTEYSPNHVPLYFFLGAGWARFVGWSQLPMRYLSLLFGILFVAWTYRFAADALNRSTAIAAAMLMTTSGFVLLYFHEIRMYTLLLLLTAIHAWLYWRLSTRDSAKRREWLLLIVSASSLLYTHIFSVFFFASLALQHLFFAKQLKHWLRIVLAWGIGALTFLPYLPGYLQGALAERTIASLRETALTAPELASGLAHIIVNGVELLWLPLLVLPCVALWKRCSGCLKLGNRTLARMLNLARNPPSPMLWGEEGGGVRKRISPTDGHFQQWNLEVARLLVIWAGFILSLMLFNEYFPLIDRLRFRFFLASMPFFAILCAHILLTPGRLRAVAFLFVPLWIAGGAHIYGLGDSWAYAGKTTIFADIPPLHKYADALQSRTRTLDTIVGFSRSKFADWPLRHGKSIADYYFGAILNLDHSFIVAQSDDADIRLSLDQHVFNYPYLLLANDPAHLPALAGRAIAAIEAEYAACDILVDGEDLVVQRYVYKSLACDRAYLPIHYKNGIKIVDRFGVYDGDRESIRVVSGWEVADQAQLDEFNVSIQLLTSDWQNQRQAPDRHLYDDILKWYAVELSTAGLPPGDYQVVIILYDRYTKAKVSGADIVSGETGTIFPILKFRIEA